MKKIILMLSLMAMFLNGCASFSYATKNMVNRPAPNVHFSILDGDFVSLRQYRGKTVVLLFWATWCHRSKDLITQLNNYARQYRGGDVEFLAVSIDKYENVQTLRNMVYLQGLDGLKHAFSGNDVRDEAYYAFHMITVPSIAVIGPDGYVKGIGNSMDVVRKYTARY